MQPIHSFKPIIDQDARVLILGSMPGKVSLAKNQYYAHPQNRFWDFIYSIFNTPIDADYEAKKAFLKSRKIALWDVIRDCQRSGSSDSKIINPIINDFSDLIARYPDIKCILFNGKKAEQVFQRYLNNFPGIQFTTLPSSSPANASISPADKLKAWSVIKELAK